MSSVTAEFSADIEAPAAKAYAVIADYRVGHPAILPKPYFTHLDVMAGGYGAGTVIRFGMKMGGRVQEVIADVTEPEPGRILVERVRDERGTVTHFMVEPLDPGRARVTIRTSWQARGLQGVIERLLAPSLLRRIYRAELANLERRAAADALPHA